MDGKCLPVESERSRRAMARFVPGALTEILTEEKEKAEKIQRKFPLPRKVARVCTHLARRGARPARTIGRGQVAAPYRGAYTRGNQAGGLKSCAKVALKPPAAANLDRGPSRRCERSAAIHADGG